MPNKNCFHPIIYVRGFAATQSEVEETVADPYMGFNIGSTKSRQSWTGEFKKFFFESPLVRLQTDFGYEDIYFEGEDLLESERSDVFVPYKSVVIYRYYDTASESLGNGKTPPIEFFAEGLAKLILKLRNKICGQKDSNILPQDFKVYLVAHSMGGLICRCFLQNKSIGNNLNYVEARSMVDKVFTYATPHNGIDLRVVRNIPGWLTMCDLDTFKETRQNGLFFKSVS